MLRGRRRPGKRCDVVRMPVPVVRHWTFNTISNIWRDVMEKMTLIAGAIGCALAAAIAADAAAKNLIPNPRGQEADASLHRVELFDCSPCSKGGHCPKVCATAPPPKPSKGDRNTHGCACLHNETGRPINFRYHWGKGDWTIVNM